MMTGSGPKARGKSIMRPGLIGSLLRETLDAYGEVCAVAGCEAASRALALR
jgi:hypothetical protein